jgi:cell division initiation protein
LKISPLDIRNQTFRTVFRGADNEEVRVFLDLVATEYEGLVHENANLTERLRHAEDRLADFRNIEQTLRDGVLTAERLASDARESSKRESILVIQDAELRAERILEDARRRLGRLAEEIRDLQTKRDIYAEQMRTFLVSHMEMLERNEQYLEGLDRVSEEASALVSRTRRPEARPIAPPPPPRGRPEAQPEIGFAEPQQPAAPGYPPASAYPAASPAPPPARRPAAPAPSQPAPAPAAPSRGGIIGRLTQRSAAQAPQYPAGSAGEEEFDPLDDPGPDSGIVSPPRPIASSPERSEGLFEISADDEEPPSRGRR